MADETKKISMVDFIAEIAGEKGCISVHPVFVEICRGDWTLAAFLSQCVYWWLIADKKTFWKTDTQWKMELRILPRTSMRCRRRLADMGFIGYQLVVDGAKRHNYYTVNIDEISAAIAKVIEDRKVTKQHNMPKQAVVSDTHVVPKEDMVTTCHVVTEGDNTRCQSVTMQGVKVSPSYIEETTGKTTESEPTTRAREVGCAEEPTNGKQAEVTESRCGPKCRGVPYWVEKYYSLYSERFQRKPGGSKADFASAEALHRRFVDEANGTEHYACREIYAFIDAFWQEYDLERTGKGKLGNFLMGRSGFSFTFFAGDMMQMKLGEMRAGHQEAHVKKWREVGAVSPQSVCETCGSAIKTVKEFEDEKLTGTLECCTICDFKDRKFVGITTKHIEPKKLSEEELGEGLKGLSQALKERKIKAISGKSPEVDRLV